MNISTQHAQTKVRELRRFLSTVTSLNERRSKVFARAIIRELELAYASANFDMDLEPAGETCWSLYEADVALAVANAIASDHGFEPLTHDDVERRYHEQARRTP